MIRFASYSLLAFVLLVIALIAAQVMPVP